MILRGVRVFKLEYAIGEQSFKTTIAGTTLEAALKFLQTHYKDPMRVTMIEPAMDLKLMMPEVVNVIVNAVSPASKDAPTVTPPKKRGRRKANETSTI